MRRILLLCCLLLPWLGCVAGVPTTLREVDLRGMRATPEQMTWLGSLQGAINRQNGDTAVMIIGSDTDAAWADMLVKTYQLKKEVLTAGAFLETQKAALTGQVRYDPAQPWTRNIALTAAALQPGLVIATDADLGVPTVLDFRNKWLNRQEAYAWAITKYADKADGHAFVLAPDSGHLLADFISARQLLAVDLSLEPGEELDLLTTLLKRYPAHSCIFGDPDDHTLQQATFQKFDALALAHNDTLVPVRYTPNLSCLARFPAIRPIVQGRNETAGAGEKPIVVFVYGAGKAVPGGSRSLDYARETVQRLLTDRALTSVPVGIEVPTALWDVAPAIYQAFITRQRLCAAEFIAAPTRDNLEMVKRHMDLDSMWLSGSTDLTTCRELTGELVKAKWLGAFEPSAMPFGALPAFLAWPTSDNMITKPAELLAALPDSKMTLKVLHLDPAGVTPEMLRRMLPEISRTCMPMTPSQALRATHEISYLLPYLKAHSTLSGMPPKRGKRTLTVDAPTTTVTILSAADAIPVTVHIAGPTPVLAARVIYKAPDGRRGAADLQEGEMGNWSTTLPPMLTGGTLEVHARVVEQGGFAESISPSLTLEIPTVDSDRDGLDDTLESYLGSDPKNFNTTGDGLPDGLSDDPTRYHRDIISLLPAVIPPADGPLLADAGASTADEQGRLIPAGKAITYRLPLRDLPAAQAWLRVVSSGKGTVALNGKTPAALDILPADQAVTVVPLRGAKPLGADLTVTLTADAKPLRILALELITNPDGPYLLPVQFDPPFPFAGAPIPVQVMAYDHDGIKSVRLYYHDGESKTFNVTELKPVEGSGNVLFAGTLPAQTNDSLLIYGVEAEDRKGRITAGPYGVVPVGRMLKHDVALFGTRDLHDGWTPAPVWGSWGRVQTDGTAADTALFSPRQGTYYVWLLAAPRQRAIDVSIEERILGVAFSNEPRTVTKLSRELAVGQPDGWYLLGSFPVGPQKEASSVLHINITPRGAKGYCAYNELVLTQDAHFTPPLTHAGIDWYNSIMINGLEGGQMVHSKISLTTQVTGNIDRVVVYAQRLYNNKPGTDLIPFERQGDGSYLLNTKGLEPGSYKVTASATSGAGEDVIPLASTSVRVEVR